MGDWFDIGGSALGAIGSIGGGLLGRGSSSDGFSKKGAVRQALFEQGAAPTRANTLLQFAKSAKLHPLAVIGSGAHSQPVIQGESADNRSIGSGVSAAMNNMGQDISDATMRTQTRQMRDLDLIHKAVQIENDNKYGELLSEQIRKERNPPPPSPISSDGTVVVPKQLVKTQEKNPSLETATQPIYQWRTTDKKGGQRKVLAEGMDEKFESDAVNSFIYNMENILDYIGGYLNSPAGDKGPPRKKLPPGYTHWKRNPFNKTWYPAKGERKATNRKIVEHMKRTLNEY